MAKAVKIIGAAPQGRLIAECPFPGCGQKYELELDPGMSEDAARQYSEDELLDDHKEKKRWHSDSFTIPTQRTA